MLGELVAQEVFAIDQEKSCNCHDCCSHRATRKALVHKATLACACPVCTATIKALKEHLDAMFLYLQLAEEQEKEINEIRNKLIIVPEENDYMEAQAMAREKNLAGAIALSTTIENLIVDFQNISKAAHNAYDLVAETAALSVRPTNLPPQANYLDIN
jgi:nitrate reductase NapAB chaperone NapD